MKRKRNARRGRTPAQAYATNLLLSRERSGQGGVGTMDPSVIADAKACVDENEK